jgi:hypothetical protein
MNKGGAKAEIEGLKSLSQTAAAWILGLTPRSIRLHPEIPRQGVEGGYSVRDLVAWAVARAAMEHKGAGLIKDQTEAERFRKLKIANDASEGMLIPKEELHSFFVIFAGQLRAAGAALERQHGPAARKILDNVLDALGKQLDGAAGETKS